MKLALFSDVQQWDVEALLQTLKRVQKLECDKTIGVGNLTQEILARLDALKIPTATESSISTVLDGMKFVVSYERPDGGIVDVGHLTTEAEVAPLLEALQADVWVTRPDHGHAFCMVVGNRRVISPGKIGADFPGDTASDKYTFAVFDTSSRNLLVYAVSDGWLLRIYDKDGKRHLGPSRP